MVVVGVNHGLGLGLLLVSTPPSSDSLSEIVELGFFCFQILIVDTPQVSILKFDVLELGGENIHFAAVFENYMAIEVDKCDFGRVSVRKLDESFPYFGLLENEYLHNLAVLTK